MRKIDVGVCAPEFLDGLYQMAICLLCMLAEEPEPDLDNIDVTQDIASRFMWEQTQNGAQVSAAVGRP